jgi:hypothetical protein
MAPPSLPSATAAGFLPQFLYACVATTSLPWLRPQQSCRSSLESVTLNQPVVNSHIRHASPNRIHPIIRQQYQSVFQSDRGDPHIVNINTETAQMPLRINPSVRGWMRPPNPLHDLSVTVSRCNPYLANKFHYLIFDKPTTSCAPLGVGGSRNAKATL